MSLDGVIDSSFDVGTGADDGYVTALVPLNDASNSLVAGGLYNTFNKQKYPHVVRLTTTGAISPDFAAVPVNDNVFAAAAQIDPALGTPDPAAPQFLIGGTFTAIGSTAYTKLARINYDGSVDASFKPVIDERVLAIAAQPDGKIIIGGQFAVVNGQTVGHLARLNAGWFAGHDFQRQRQHRARMAPARPSRFTRSTCCPMAASTSAAISTPPTGWRAVTSPASTATAAWMRVSIPAWRSRTACKPSPSSRTTA